MVKKIVTRHCSFHSFDQWFVTKNVCVSLPDNGHNLTSENKISTASMTDKPRVLPPVRKAKNVVYKAKGEVFVL